MRRVGGEMRERAPVTWWDARERRGVCPVCGRAFSTRSRNKVYCCEACRRAAAEVRRKGGGQG